MILLNFIFLIFIFAFALFINNVYAIWTAPGSAPPEGNVAEPINVGDTAQYKNGKLTVRDLAVDSCSAVLPPSCYNTGVTCSGGEFNPGCRLFVSASGGHSIQSINNDNNDGAAAVYGYKSTDNGSGILGTGKYGVKGVGKSGVNNNVGVYGSGDTGIKGSGNEYGVYGVGTVYGVYGYSSSNYGVYGRSLSNVGVYGYSSSNYGVYGFSSSSYAGYFNGDVYVDEDLSVGGDLSVSGSVAVSGNFTAGAIILKAINGNCFKLKVDKFGNVGSDGLTCP